MRSEHLDRLSNLVGAGFDVGFISYFTRARMWDFYGLVDGTDFARMSFPDRVDHIARIDPGFLFVTPREAGRIKDNIRLEDYTVIHKYLFKNVGPTEPHFLAVKTSLLASVGMTGTARLDTIDTTPLE
jgi:hypothetical protein